MIDPSKTLKNFRKFHGYKQKDLAEVLHMSHVMISLWERGEVPISFDNMQILLDFMGYELKIMKKKEEK